MHIVQIVSSATTVLLQVSQIAILLITGQYAVYLLGQILITLASNLTLSLIATKKYPYLKEKNIEKLKKEDRIMVAKNLKATFLYKLGNTVMNSTTNLLISVIVGTVFVGYYSNYLTVFTMVNALIMIFIQAILASVGNYYATHNEKDKFKMFKLLLWMFYVIATFCTSCYICGTNDFIALWLGEEFVLKGAFVFVAGFNQFVYIAIHPLWITRESTGVFVSTRYLMLFAAGVNVILAGVFGRLFGLVGIIFATAVAYCLTVFWYEPKQLCKRVFHLSAREYWKYISKLLVAVAPTIAIACVLNHIVTTNILALILKFFICGIVTFASFWIVTRKTLEYQKIKTIVLEIIDKYIKKSNNF